MDEKFLDTLKTFSVKDIIEDVRRPTTSTANRLRTATTARRGPRSSQQDAPIIESPASIGNSSNRVIETIHRPGTSMVSNKPPSSAFASSKNRTGWRLESAAPTKDGGMRGRPGTTMRPTTSRTGLLGFSQMDEDDEDMHIPDLAEVAEEEFTQMIANAPEYEVQRLTSLRELDAELAKNKSFCMVDGIDLRKLARSMVPERKLIELDDAWTYNSLYSELATRFEDRRALDMGGMAKKSQK